MIPQELLATAAIPGDAGELKLYRHDADYIIRIDGIDLMNSRAHGSEELLAELALGVLSDLRAARVLIGGLGMGYTLAAVLGLVGEEARVEVAELVPEVVEWNKRWIGELNGHPLSDPRAFLRVEDVVPCIRGARAGYDAILLDVDNGPEGLTRGANNRLYSKVGLAAARNALRPGGVLGVWSSGEQPGFTSHLQRAGFAVREEPVRARRNKGPRHKIWLAIPD